VEEALDDMPGRIERIVAERSKPEVRT
jgi:hypothetical protein